MDVWTVKVQCRKSDLPPLLSCTMPHSELTLEVRPATSVPSVVSLLLHTGCQLASADGDVLCGQGDWLCFLSCLMHMFDVYIGKAHQRSVG